MQFTGLAAMFKVLFPEQEHILLTENELSGLFNLIHRLSSSIKWYREWRDYEDQQILYKSLLLAGIIGIAAILFLFAILLFFYKPKKTEETIPLRANQQPS